MSKNHEDKGGDKTEQEPKYEVGLGETQKKGRTRTGGAGTMATKETTRADSGGVAIVGIICLDREQRSQGTRSEWGS